MEDRTVVEDGTILDWEAEYVSTNEFKLFDVLSCDEDEVSLIIEFGKVLERGGDHGHERCVVRTGIRNVMSRVESSGHSIT